MTLRQLEYVLAVVEAGSFTRAAQKLHVSQPSLSQQVQALEAEVGGRLFDRPPQPVRLTPAGRALAEEARVAVRAAERAVAGARRALGTEPRAVSVATVRSLAVSMLPASLSRWHDAQPESRIELREYAHPREVERAVLEGTAELGVGPAPRGWRGASRRLGWDQLVAVLPPGDPLLGSPRAVALEAMADRRWVLFEPSHGLADNVREACAAAGFEPAPVVLTAQVEAAAQLAASGLGPALVPSGNVPEELRWAMRELDPPAAWELAVFTRERRFGVTARAFVDTLAAADWQRACPPGARVLRLRA